MHAFSHTYVLVTDAVCIPKIVPTFKASSLEKIQKVPVGEVAWRNMEYSWTWQTYRQQAAQQRLLCHSGGMLTYLVQCSLASTCSLLCWNLPGPILPRASIGTNDSPRFSTLF